MQYFNPISNKKLVKKKNFYLDKEKGKKFYIKKNIPRFLLEESKNSKMWERQWKKYSRTQLDSYTKKNKPR